MLSSASLWDCSHVSDNPAKSKFFSHILLLIKGTLLGTVCGQSPWVLKNTKLLIIGESLVAGFVGSVVCGVGSLRV